ncbi:MAG TPA: 4-(cytidine 5'-diphospho)-2-C-methyl-D-erythritol kinase [Candidatus Binataceae bacterium]|nr:4-(cytidine 5'-diphospho)-2-C-methyl-D-erythritol kinase [Candidatus Binataceae bacterium]
MVRMLAERAPAKINLGLRVTGRRADGYHELDSIFLPIDWSDLVRVEVRPASGPSVALRCNRADLADAASNLASRAAAAFAREYALDAQIMVDLEKHLPSGAGLGGGSSDAGAVLRMMAAMHGVALDERLAKLALSLGADVPYFLDPRPARVRGIGEKIEPLAAMPSLHLVVAAPGFEAPTAKVFRALKPSGFSGAIPDAVFAAIAAGKVPREAVVNDLAAPAIALYPRIGELLALVEAHGASASAMSGSGASVFGIFPTRVAAQDAARSLAAAAPDARVIACATLASPAAS